MTVTEVRRTAAKSYLEIPGFNDRTAVQARWAMCAFTELAMKRGFKFWTVVYPPEESGEDLLVVAFSNSDRKPPAELLGSDYVSERTPGGDMASVEVFQSFCEYAGFL
jgi:hypothetical protein